MFEKLLALLLHAKGGAVSAVLVLGATGALVTATTQNGVTTVTIAETSPSTAAASLNGNASLTPTTSLLVRNGALVPVSAPSVLTGSASPSPCRDEAHARNEAVHQVDRTFSKYHTQLAQMRRFAKTDVARKAVEDADKLIKEIRQAAVKAIHMTGTCVKKDDDENDKDDEDDNDDDDKDQHNEHKSTAPKVETTSPTTPAVTPVTLNATDPKAIAQLAESAMKAAFDAAKAIVGDVPAPKQKHENDRRDNDKSKGDKDKHD